MLRLHRWMPRLRPQTRALAMFWSSPSTEQKKRVVVLGTGWAGFRFLKALKKDRYEVTCVAPRNHFIFTPLLPSTTVGTLEFRCVIEPVRTLLGLSYLQAECDDIDTANRTLVCHEVFQGTKFIVPYDYLVIAVGARANTFGISGVHEHAFFLKDLNDARLIRQRILECFERASNPAIPDNERDQLLTFVVVGGGPTSVEFAGELHDFIREDVSVWFPDLVQNHVKIVLIEATDHILGSFDAALSDYVMSILKARSDLISVRTLTHIKEVRKGEVELKTGEIIRCGAVVWSTGISANPLIASLKKNRQLKTDARSGRLLVDDHLRVLDENGNALEGVFAMGDCATPEQLSLPPTAQVAQQQGKYLAKMFNKSDLAMDVARGNGASFRYRHFGMMASVGGYRAVADLKLAGWGVRGFLAWLFWRSAYFTYLMSTHNKILVPMYWFKSFVFGRDVSRF